MMQPTRQTPAGRAYLDLQNRARRDGRGTQELLTLYVVERWLARLSASPYAEDFVLKGGVLLASDMSDERASNGTQPERRPPSDDELLEYPFPLAQGGVAYLRLPRWLSTVDAERIGDHVKTLAIDRPADQPNT